MNDFGKRVRAVRESLGMNGSKFAERCGIERAAMSRIENGHVTPSLGSAIAIAKALGMSLDYLCGLDATTTDTSEVERRVQVMRQIEELKSQL